MKIISKEIINEWFTYKDGELYSKKERVGCPIGKKLGGITDKGYKILVFKNKKYFVHRLIFIMHHGHLSKFIDHIDNNPLNNKIENLRECNNSQNMVNRKKKQGTKSKYKGVTICEGKKSTTYVASITHLGVRTHLGRYKNERSAALRFLMESQKRHGEFINFKK